MITTKKKMPIISPIHKGDSTHTHDHVILPRSFKVIKTIASNPKNPIPLDVCDELLDISLSFP